MSSAVKSVMIQLISKRLKKKESLEEIFADYPRLSDADKEELKQELGVNQKEQGHDVEK